MGEFLRRHGPLVVDGVAHWYGSAVPEEALARVLRNLRFVAETYGFVVPLAAWRRALVDLTAILSLWASARGGAPLVYGNGDRKPRRRRRRLRRVAKRRPPRAKKRTAKKRAKRPVRRRTSRKKR